MPLFDTKSSADHAVMYHEWEWPIAPFHAIAEGGGCTCTEGTSCPTPAKHHRRAIDAPILTADAIRSFWDAFPDSNIGIACGRGSPIVVLDVDESRGGLVTLDDLEAEHGKIPPGMRARTGSGALHIYFSATPHEPMPSGPIRQGLTLIADDGWVLAPPSRHHSGMSYSWQGADLELPDVPEWLADLIYHRIPDTQDEPATPDPAQGAADRCTVAVSEWARETPDLVTLAVEADKKLRRLFNRDKRLKVSKGAPSALDSALAHALYRAGIDDPRTLAFGLMASRFDDADLWARAADLAPNYFGDIAVAAINGSRGDMELALETERTAHEALRADPNRWWNEMGNADRFYEIQGSEILYHDTEKRWRVWDGRLFAESGGTRGDSPSRGGIGGVEMRVQGFLDDLKALPDSITDQELKDDAIKFVRACGTSSHSKAILALCQARCEVSETELDTDPYMLNALNGIVDLKTGQVFDHDRRYRATMIAGAAYDPASTSEVWDGLIERVMPDAETRSYLQKCLGYSLLGVQPEQIFCFVHGPGSTGKSTVIKAVTAAMGTYHRAADSATFLKASGGAGAKSGSSATPDLARLSRVRMVSSTEVEHGSMLNDGLIKQLSGGDTMTTRGLYAGDMQEWRPRMVLWFCANDRPRARVDDDALWRRLRPFEFNQVVSDQEQDSTLGARLEAPEVRRAVLAWIVAGAREYLDSGHLEMPAAVRAGVQSYRDDSNQLSEFYEDCTVSEEGAFALRAELWKRYIQWRKDNDVKQKLAKGNFFKIVASDFEYDEGNNARLFRGLRILTAGSSGPSSAPEGEYGSNEWENGSVL